jgi:uncharacterized metal-binding protein
MWKCHENPPKHHPFLRLLLKYSHSRCKKYLEKEDVSEFSHLKKSQSRPQIFPCHISSSTAELTARICTQIAFKIIPPAHKTTAARRCPPNKMKSAKRRVK